MKTWHKALFWVIWGPAAFAIDYFQGPWGIVGLTLAAVAGMFLYKLMDWDPNGQDGLPKLPIPTIIGEESK